MSETIATSFNVSFGGQTFVIEVSGSNAALSKLDAPPGYTGFAGRRDAVV